MSLLRRACTRCQGAAAHPSQSAQSCIAQLHSSASNAAWNPGPPPYAGGGPPSASQSNRPHRARPIGSGKPLPGKAHRNPREAGGGEYRKPWPGFQPDDLLPIRDVARTDLRNMPSIRPKPIPGPRERRPFGQQEGREGGGGAGGNRGGYGRRFDANEGREGGFGVRGGDGGSVRGSRGDFGRRSDGDEGGDGGFGARAGGDRGRGGEYGRGIDGDEGRGGGFGARAGGDRGRGGGYGSVDRDQPRRGGFGIDRTMTAPRHDAGQINDRSQYSRRGPSRGDDTGYSRPTNLGARTAAPTEDATPDEDVSTTYDEPDQAPGHRRHGAGPRGIPSPGRGVEGEKASRSYRAAQAEGGAGDFVLSRGRDRAREEPKESRRGKDREAMIADRIRSERAKKEIKEVEVKGEKKVFVPSSVSVGRLADIFGVKIFNLQRTMQRLGLSEDQRRSDYLLTSEEACNIALEYGLDPTVDDERTFDIFPEPEQEGVVQPLRPPVVTIMGHVDHGKTTLLDSLRHSSVATGEAGGITQHIGAFSVPLSSLLPSVPSDSDTPGTITFLDTPGHAAFTAMRARGASVTDMIVLVVAADDGVMPQTREVIELWKADQDKVGLVVAINKCDKPGIDFDKIKSALGAEGILLEEDGGDIPSVRVSGLKGEGLDKLVETLSTLAEIRELRARSAGKAEGYVLESRVDKGQGNVATVLVSKGTLTAGTCIVAGTTWARVRQMQDSAGRSLRSAPPGTPVSIMGWRDIPHAGDQLLEASSEDEAKKALTNRLREIENRKLLVDVESINQKRVAERKKIEKEEEEIARLKEAGKSESEIQAWKRDTERAQAAAAASGTGDDGAGRKELRLVIKGDVSGSVEAVVGSLEGIGNKEAGVKIVHVGVGEVGESDVHMAEAAGASIIAFSVPTPRSTQNLARSLNIPLHVDSVIYRLIETVRSEVIKLLPPIYETRVTGEATCQQIFEIKLKGKDVMRIAGCKVGNGVIEIKEGVGIRILRGSERTQVYEGTIETLKHLKKDTTEVRKGTECGMSFHDFADVKEGDEIIAFTKFEVPRHL